ncbi:MAG: NFACT family protein, partial [Balneolaceae bacterium]
MFSLSPHRNVWEGYFEIQGRNRLRLVFSTTPGEIALFTNTYRPPKKSNVLYFFESLQERVVKQVSLAEGDRLLTIEFDNGSQLLFQLFGHSANLFHVKGGEVTDAFKNPGKVSGKAPPQPRKPAAKNSKIPEFKSVKQGLLFFDKKLPRHLVSPIIDHYKLDKTQPEQIKDTVDKLVDSMKKNPSFRILKDGNLCLIPEEDLPLENEKEFDNINEAIRFAYYRSSHLRRFSNKLQSIQPVIKSELEKARRTLQQLEEAEKALERAETYKQYGHLLMAHAHEKPEGGQQHIEIKNFYEENELQKITDHIRTFCKDDRWPRGELNLPRPLVTEKAYPEDEAVLTTSFDIENEGSVFNEIVYERRIGAQNQLEIAFPFGYSERSNGNWTGGHLGDMAVGVKRILHHS